LIVFILIFFFSRTHIAENPQRNFYEIKGQAQGTTYSIRYLYSDSVVSKAEVDSIFKAIDLSLSLYKKESLINLFNRNGSVRMDEHMKNVVERSLAINKSSHRGFDITVKTLVDLWGFGVNGKKAIPSTKQIKKALSVTGSNLIFIKNDSLLARKKNVQIDCNGIAQGYSVDLIFHYLEKKGIEDILVEIGGEVRVKGKNAEGGNWKVGLESPSGITEEWYPVNEVLELDSKAVTTSGDYRNFFRDKGKMYSVNHGNFFQYDIGVKNYIDSCQKRDKANGGPYTQRYIGSMVSDVHRNLIKGGIFMYPGTTDKPKGKLRLLYECNPFAFIVEVAGGKATNGKERILDVQPTELHQRTPMFIGSREMMDELASCITNASS